MLPAEREKIVEDMARAICSMDGTDPDSDAFPMHADPRLNVAYPAWHDYVPNARAALAFAEQAIREACATKLDFMRQCTPNEMQQAILSQAAAAIRNQKGDAP